MPWSWDRWTAPTLSVTSFTGKMHQPHWLANSVSVLAWRGVGCEGCCADFYKTNSMQNGIPPKILRPGKTTAGIKTMSHDTVSPVFEHGKHRGKHVKELVDDLLSENVLPEDLTPFVCIKFGEEEYWAVFGNRRLKALKYPFKTK